MASSRCRVMRYMFFSPLMLFLVGCVDSTPIDLAYKFPDHWDTPQSMRGRPVSLHSWWKTFNDPTLDVLVGDALANNLDIAEAEQRLQKARILNGTATSRYMPHLSAAGHPVQDAAARDTYFHTSVDMIWELSLYGEAANLKRASDAVVLSAQAREQAVRVSVVASVVQNYLRYQFTRQQSDMFEKQQSLESRWQALAAVRDMAHIGTASDIAASRLRAAGLQAEDADLLALQEQTLRALALLTGKTSQQVAAMIKSRTLSVPDFRIEQVPTDLLRTRPDIRQAEADVLQAAAEVGLAKAALYPRLTLSGSILYAYSLTANRHSGNSTPSLGPVIDIPLWDWGQRLAQKQAQEHELQAALLGYRKTVLEGVSETENALSSLSYQNKRIASLNTAFEQQNRLQHMQSTLVKLGLSSEYDGLSGQNALLQMQSGFVQAQFGRAMAFVTLYKALGGAPLPEMAVTSSFASIEDKQ